MFQNWWSAFHWPCLQVRGAWPSVTRSVMNVLKSWPCLQVGKNSANSVSSVIGPCQRGLPITVRTFRASQEVLAPFWILAFVALAAVVVISCVSVRLRVTFDDSGVNRVQVNRVRTSLSALGCILLGLGMGMGLGMGCILL